MSLGTRLKELVAEKHMKQKEVAADIPLAPSTFNSYVRDYRKPDIDTLMRLSSYFNVTTDYLLDCETEIPCDHQEKELVQVFRALNKNNKTLALELIKVIRRLQVFQS